MESTGSTIAMAGHSIRRGPGSLSHSPSRDSPLWPSTEVPRPSSHPWRTSDAIMCDLRISLRERRVRSRSRPPSDTVAQCSCCTTLRSKFDKRLRWSSASENVSLPAPANALAPKGKRANSVIRRSLSKRYSRRTKKATRVAERMKIELREEWEQRDAAFFGLTEVLPGKPDTMGSTPTAMQAGLSTLSFPTITVADVPMALENGSEAVLSSPMDKPKNKPKVLILATGGTIAGRGLSPTHSAGYESGVLGVSDLVEAVPYLHDVAEVLGSQFCEVGSPDLRSDTLIRLAQEVQTQLNREDLDAIVITHGTDTLEETSFFLDLTVHSSKPVVVTGSMLPSTSLSPDGPKNLFEAVCVAATPSSRDRGVLVVFNGKIMPARFTVKSDANMIETFDPGLQGCLGQVFDTKPLYYWPPARPLGHRHVDISSLAPEEGLPKVGILYGHLGVDDGIFEAHVRSGVKGLVLAGMGAGCWTHSGKDQLEKVIGSEGYEEKGPPSIPVVTSFRSSRGCVALEKGIFGVPDWVIRSGFLSPAKSCKLLQVCLAVSMTPQEIKQAFSI